MSQITMLERTSLKMFPIAQELINRMIDEKSLNQLGNGVSKYEDQNTLDSNMNQQLRHQNPNLDPNSPFTFIELAKL